DGTFEIAVLQRMVFDLDRQTLVRWIERGPFGHRPGLEDAAVLEPQIIVQTARRVLLDDKAGVFGPADLGPAAGLRRLCEIALGLVLGKLPLGHPSQASSHCQVQRYHPSSVPRARDKRNGIRGTRNWLRRAGLAGAVTRRLPQVAPRSRDEPRPSGAGRCHM